MSIPNFITIARFFLIPLFVVLMLDRQYTIALVVFLFAGFTDAVDGYIARKYKMITKLGQILDPLADKLVLLTALVMIAVQNLVPNIYPIIVIVAAKEILICIGSAVLFRKGVVVKANWYGKVSTVIFYAAITLSILIPAYGRFLMLVAVSAAIFAFIMYCLNYLRIRKSISYTR